MKRIFIAACAFATTTDGKKIGSMVWLKKTSCVGTADITSEIEVDDKGCVSLDGKTSSMWKCRKDQKLEERIGQLSYDNPNCTGTPAKELLATADAPETPTLSTLYHLTNGKCGVLFGDAVKNAEMFPGSNGIDCGPWPDKKHTKISTHICNKAVMSAEEQTKVEGGSMDGCSCENPIKTQIYVTHDGCVSLNLRTSSRWVCDGSKVSLELYENAICGGKPVVTTKDLPAKAELENLLTGKCAKLGEDYIVNKQMFPGATSVGCTTISTTQAIPSTRPGVASDSIRARSLGAFFTVGMFKFVL